jgi:hypothetical protein
MTPPEKYRRRAQHFLKLAQTCQDLQIAHRLRVIAADYFDAGRARNKPAQPQQQVQSAKKASR